MKNRERLTLDMLKKRNDWREAVIIFTKDSFATTYTEEERSYKVLSSCDWFYGIGSLYGDCLNGADDGVCLSSYLAKSNRPWKIEYCYIVA